MIQYVPLQPVPNQTLNIVLAEQICTINVYQKSTGVFLDLLIDGIMIVSTRACKINQPIIRSVFFSGDLSFVDLQGSDDPYYTGFDTRWVLAFNDGQ